MRRHCSIATLYQVVQQVDWQDQHENDHERDQDRRTSFDARFAEVHLSIVVSLLLEFFRAEEILRDWINTLLVAGTAIELTSNGRANGPR